MYTRTKNKKVLLSGCLSYRSDCVIIIFVCLFISPRRVHNFQEIIFLIYLVSEIFPVQNEYSSFVFHRKKILERSNRLSIVHQNEFR